MSRAISVNDDTLTVHVDGRQFSVKLGSVQGKRAVEALKNNDSDERLVEILDTRSAIESFTNGRVTVSNGTVTIYGETLPEVLAQRLLSLMERGLPFRFLENFWLRLRLNPSFRVREQLYAFIENEGMAITENGMIRAYKAITVGWMDKWTGTISNRIGATPVMPRSQVCDDPQNACAPGLHMGALAYATGYAGGSDRVVIVECNPVNVVCIPIDCSCQKMRTCGYRVIEEYKGKLPEFVRDTGSSYDNAVEERDCDTCRETVDNEPRATFVGGVLTLDLSDENPCDAARIAEELVERLQDET